MNDQKIKKATRKNYLIPESEITLYTRNAYHYLQGRIKEVMGLFQFNKVIRELNQYAARDNPYARWILWQTQDQLHQARYQLQRFEKRYSKLLKTGRNQRKLATAHKPIVIKLWGVPIYTFMAGDLISDYDVALSAILTAKIAKRAVSAYVVERFLLCAAMNYASIYLLSKVDYGVIFFVIDYFMRLKCKPEP